MFVCVSEMRTFVIDPKLKRYHIPWVKIYGVVSITDLFINVKWLNHVTPVRTIARFTERHMCTRRMRDLFMYLTAAQRLY